LFGDILFGDIFFRERARVHFDLRRRFDEMYVTDTERHPGAIQAGRTRIPSDAAAV
jgi:hypothetical protein